MPLNAVFLALGAGLISAVVFASATTGPPLLRIVLFFLTPLSLYLTGLGLGPRAASIAAIAAIAIVLTIGTPTTAAVYAVSTALPAVALTRLALLSRTEDDTIFWYPIGRIIIAAALFAAAFTTLALMMIGPDTEALAKAVRELIGAFAKAQLTTLPNGETLTEAQLDDIAAATLRTLPWALSMVAMTTMLLNLWLAGRVTLASGRLSRPWPKLAAAALPPSAIWALFAGTAVSFAGGMLGLIGGGFAGAFTLAFALIGLAVAHVVTEGSPWRSFILVFMYTAFAFMTVGAALILACVGVADTVFAYRARNAEPRGRPDPS